MVSRTNSQSVGGRSRFRVSSGLRGFKVRAREQDCTKCGEVPELVPERHSTIAEEKRNVPGAEARSFPLRLFPSLPPPSRSHWEETS